MRIFKTTLVIAALVLASDAFAINLIVERRDQKLATQQMVEKQTITNPAAAGTADVLSAHAGNTSAAAASATTFVAQPDVPRNLKLTPGGSTGDLAACTVTIAGTNLFGSSISETCVFAADATTACTGSKAFNTVTSVSFPANCEEDTFSTTWSLGYGESLGVKRCMDATGHIFHSTLAGAKEATAPTMVVDADEIEKNTADFSGTMNGSNDFELFFMQNYRCFP